MIFVVAALRLGDRVCAWWGHAPGRTSLYEVVV